MTKKTLTRDEIEYGARTGNLGVDAVREVCARLLLAEAPVPVDHPQAGMVGLERAAAAYGLKPTTSERHIRDLVMIVKLLVRTVRKNNPNSERATNAMAYLQLEGLISISDALRDGRTER